MGMLSEQQAKPPTKLKQQSPSMMVALDTGDTSFNFALEVANVFDNIVINTNQHVLTDKTLIATYQNHVLNNANYSTYW